MTDERVLVELVGAADRVEPDWADALRRAHAFDKRLRDARDRFRTRHAVALVAVVLATGYAVAAVAADQSLQRPVYWLFDRSPKTYPTAQTPSIGHWKAQERARRSAFCKPKVGCALEILRVPVLQGEVAGHRWEMVVLFGKRETGRPRLLTVGLSPGGTPAPQHGTNVPPVLGGAAAGYTVRWMPGGENAEDRVFWGDGVYIPGPIQDGGGTGPKWHFGPAAPNVAEIDLENNDGRVVRVPTFAGPPTLPAPTRLWVAALPLTHLVHSIVARDAEGTVLERHELPIAQ